MFLEDHTNLVSIVIVSNINSFVIITLCMIGHFSVYVEASHVISVRTVTLIPKHFWARNWQIDWRLLFPYLCITP